MAQNWTEKSERGHFYLLRLITWIARTCGRPATRILLYPIAFYFYCTDKSTRHESKKYLARVLPHVPRQSEVFFHFLTFARVLLDRVYFLLNRKEKFDIRVFDDAFAAEEERLRRTGVFMMGAHMGSFEVLRLISRSKEDLKPVLLMYEANAQKISALMAAINPAAQQEIVSLGNVGAMLTVRDKLDAGGMVGMLADRTLHGEKCYQTTFLGAPANFALGPFKVAAMMRKPVLLMMGLYRGGNRYDVYLEKIADFSDAEDGSARNSEVATQAAIERYVARLEYFARSAPYNWFNFYDFWLEEEA